MGPPSFAHGFAVLSDFADFLYKTIEFWAPEYEHTVLWNDPAIGIIRPISSEPILSAKHRVGAALRDAEVFS